MAKESQIGYIVVNTRDKADGDLQGENEFENAHFCNACTVEIAKFVRKAPELAPEKQGDKEGDKEGQQLIRQDEKLPAHINSGIIPQLTCGPQPTSDRKRTSAEKSKKSDMRAYEEDSGTKRKRLDIGKIMALKNAGWPVKEIAAEMNLTNIQVSQAIYNYNKKHA